MTVETTDTAAQNEALQQEIGTLKPVEELTSDALECERMRLTEILAKHHVIVDLQEGVPTRLVYSYLCRELRPCAFEDLSDGSFCHLTACTGYCPGCFQRPWCDLGLEDTWPEDEEAGRMVYPAEVAGRTGS